MFALGTSSHVFVLRLALKNGLERKNYAQFFALVPDVDISILLIPLDTSAGSTYELQFARLSRPVLSKPVLSYH